MKWVQKKAGKHVDFVRVDISESWAKQVMQTFDIELNSTNIIFNQKGEVVWRSAVVPFNGRKAVRILESLQHS